MSQTDLKPRLDLARAIAVAAGEVTLKYFRATDLEVMHKQDGSPLTIADQEAEQLLRVRIAEKFPDDAIVGEEFGERSGTSGYRWVLDPIDGTKSFICGVPLYGTMVGVQQGDQAVVGAIYFPPLQEGMFAAKGHGSWYFFGDGEPVRARVSKKSNLSKSTVLTTCEQTLAKRIGCERWQTLGSSFAISRTWGDVYGYMLVATGRAEAMIDPVMNVWDAAAVQPIIVEAGGTFSDWQGRPRIDSGDSVASNGILHSTVLTVLNTANDENESDLP